MFYSELDRSVLIKILQIVTLYNALLLGWSVKRIDDKTYEITKRVNNINELDVKKLLDIIVSFNYINVNS